MESKRPPNTGRARSASAPDVLAPMQRRTERAADDAYEQLRVYHGTFEKNATGIVEKGLVPQGGAGLSAGIGDKKRSQGNVFFTRDKEQAAYYALSGAGTEQHRLMKVARQWRSEDMERAASDNPPRPAILRAILPQPLANRAKRDEIGDTRDFMLAEKVPPGFMLPVGPAPEADASRRALAVGAFRRHLAMSGVDVTEQHASELLDARRRRSVAQDQKALQSPYAVNAARQQVSLFKMTNPLPPPARKPWE